MNKKFTAFFTERGMTVTKNSAYGIVKGYEVNAVIFNMNALPLQMHFSFYANDGQKRNMETALRECAIKYCQFTFTLYGLAISLNDLTANKLLKRLPELTEKIIGIIENNGGLSSEYCPVCGNTFGENKKACTIDGATICIDAECVERINAVIEAENKDFADAPNNYLRGFLGALIGGLAGAAVAALLYYVGFYSSVAAVVSAWLGVFLYKKFHGKPNKMMIVIVTATTVVCMALSVFLIYLAASGIAASQLGLSLSAWDAFRIAMYDEEVSHAFYTDLAMVLLFSAIGVGLQIFWMAQSIKRKKTIK